MAEKKPITQVIKTRDTHNQFSIQCPCYGKLLNTGIECKFIHILNEINSLDKSFTLISQHLATFHNKNQYINIHVARNIDAQIKKYIDNLTDTASLTGNVEAQEPLYVAFASCPLSDPAEAQLHLEKPCTYHKRWVKIDLNTCKGSKKRLYNHMHNTHHNLSNSYNLDNYCCWKEYKE
jgi:hypothetical protein